MRARFVFPLSQWEDADERLHCGTLSQIHTELFLFSAQLSKGRLCQTQQLHSISIFRLNFRPGQGPLDIVKARPVDFICDPFALPEASAVVSQAGSQQRARERLAGNWPASLTNPSQGKGGCTLLCSHFTVSTLQPPVLRHLSNLTLASLFGLESTLSSSEKHIAQKGSALSVSTWVFCLFSFFLFLHSNKSASTEILG